MDPGAHGDRRAADRRPGRSFVGPRAGGGAARPRDGGPRGHGHRPDHPRHDHARPLAPFVRVHGPAEARSVARRGLRRVCGVHGIRVRAGIGEEPDRLARRRHGAADRGRDPDADRGLQGPQHLRAVRRRRRRGGAAALRPRRRRARGRHAQRRNARRRSRGSGRRIAVARQRGDGARPQALHLDAWQEALSFRGALHG